MTASCTLRRTRRSEPVVHCTLIGQLRSVSVAAQIARKRSFALLLFRWESQARWIAAPTGHAQWLFQDAREQAQGGTLEDGIALQDFERCGVECVNPSDAV